MLAVTRCVVPDAAAAHFQAVAQQVLDALSARSGFVRGRLGRAADDPALWVLVTEWEGMGAYRRGLSSYDVKLAFAALMGDVVNEPSAFEVISGVERPASTAGASGDDE
ncbi:MAG TPA: antibiotic biosynthesis monooxygenase [Nonomuraea sp.]|nr:antibiotic biosynthesis monooxygenase [Nonomuraea sp.]